MDSHRILSLLTELHRQHGEDALPSQIWWGLPGDPGTLFGPLGESAERSVQLTLHMLDR